MDGLRIINAGPHTTVQDSGRPGRQWLGIPEGGVIDREGLALANALVGNDAGAAVLEIWLGNFSAEVLVPMQVALTGTFAGVLEVTDTNGRPVMEIPANRSAHIAAGEIIRLAMLPDSNAAVLAVSGGFDAPLFYDSRSTSPSVGIGGFDGGVLENDATLPVGESHSGGIGERIWPEAAGITRRIAPCLIRAVPGPQEDRFTPRALEDFFSTTYTVSNDLNRMGMRLDGAVLGHTRGADIVSDGITLGAVQVPGNGLPIVLLADHQSTGGYTKIATVITADMPRLARLAPGTSLCFAAVTVTEAEAIAHAHAREWTRRIENLADAPPLR